MSETKEEKEENGGKSGKSKGKGEFKGLEESVERLASTRWRPTPLREGHQNRHHLHSLSRQVKESKLTKDQRTVLVDHRRQLGWWPK